ncbi:MAG: serine/threonine-protein kinase [Planctomycetota bacterium]|nr:serine/threonine-protein kinase [Planctomycetota bacterium]
MTRDASNPASSDPASSETAFSEQAAATVPGSVSHPARKSGRRTERELIDEVLAGVTPIGLSPHVNAHDGLISPHHASPWRRGSGSGDGLGASDNLPQQGLFPGYEILKEIHRGGQGVVYQALQLATKRRVAIKVLHDNRWSGSSGRQRFEREVQILGQLNHANIVRIHDSGVTPGPSGSFYYVMDYVSGRPLDDFISTTKGGSTKASIAEVVRMMIKIADAVNAAHLRGVIHRDLKPSNIRVNAEGEPIVLDFGLAKVAVPDVTEDDQPRLVTVTGQFIGSLPWASPEQAEGSTSGVDVRTDVYSLGVIMFQMLTGGKFPYEVVGNMRDVLNNIVRVEPARPSSLRRQVNDEVETIVLKCLQKEKERRYQSAGELARDLRRYLSGEPIEAKRDSVRYFIGKALRRYRYAAGGAAAFAAMVVIFAIAMSILFAQARRARDDAQRFAEAESQAKIQEASQRELAEQAAAAEREARLAERVERERAERNFQVVRDMARTFMYDFNDQIKPLRGATRVREAILRQAVAALEQLRTQAADDPDLLRELADGEDRVGDLKGGLYSPRLGEALAAAEHYARAREIRRRLLDLSPNQPRAIADWGVSLMKQADEAVHARKFDEARDLRRAAIDSFERALILLAADPNRAGSPSRATLERQRADAIIRLGDAYYVLAERETDWEAIEPLTSASSEQYERAREIFQSLAREARDGNNPAGNDPAAASKDDGGRAEAQRSLAVIADNLASNLTLDAMSIAQLGRPVTDAERQDAEQARRRLAAADAAIDRLNRAIAQSQANVASLTGLAASSPQSALLERHAILSLHNSGNALMRLADAHALSRSLMEAHPGLGGNDGANANGPNAIASRRSQEAESRERALAVFAQAAARARALFTADEGNVDAARQLAIMLNKLGNEQRDKGLMLADAAGSSPNRDDAAREASAWLAQAYATFSESLRVRDINFKGDRTQQFRNDLAVGHFKLGEISLRIAARPSLEADIRRVLGELGALAPADGFLDAAERELTRSLGMGEEMFRENLIRENAPLIRDSKARLQEVASLRTK